MSKGLLMIAALVLTPLASGADDELILLDVVVHVNGEELSNPRIALEPASDGSVIQGLPGERKLKLVFHSTHAGEDGTEVFVDMDFGPEDALAHVRTHRWMMSWERQAETMFTTGDGDVVHVRITPGRVTRAELETMAH
ncbi:MAG TPA: hypothetical protein VF254_04775 [Gammaproteobacteria bacterium]